MRPLFRIAITRAAGLAFTEIAVEVEISIENGQAAAFDKSLALLAGGHRSLPGTDAQSEQRKS